MDLIPDLPDLPDLPDIDLGGCGLDAIGHCRTWREFFKVLLIITLVMGLIALIVVLVIAFAS